MQSVVTGQAPITLEWTITPGGKIKQKIKLLMVHTITETTVIPHKKTIVRSAHVRIRYVRYAERVPTETEETA